MSKKNKNLYAGEYIINVLDAKYDLYIDNDPTMLDSWKADGLTDSVLKTIHIRNVFTAYDEVRYAELEFKRILRHELIHAFMYECGLTENSFEKEAWPVSESMTDFWATQFYKIDAMFKDAYQIIPDIKEKTIK